MPEIVKYSDISEKLKEINATLSNSSSRHVVNENFKLLKSTLDSIWVVLNAIYDTDTSQLGSIDLHSDVKASGGFAPSVGDVLKFDGIDYKPSVGGGGGGAATEYLPDLLDVEDFTYPNTDNSVIVYKVGTNQWEIQQLSYTLLTDFNITSSANNAILFKDSSDVVQSLDVGAEATFLGVTGGNITWQFITLDKINDINMPVSPVTGGYILEYNGSTYDLTSEWDRYGTLNFIEASRTLTIQNDYQYIVHQLLDIEGELDLDGELIVI